MVLDSRSRVVVLVVVLDAFELVKEVSFCNEHHDHIYIRLCARKKTRVLRGVISVMPRDTNYLEVCTIQCPVMKHRCPP